MNPETSTVTAVQSAWETGKKVNYYFAAGLAAAAVIENVALLAGQLAAINTAATGARNAKPGTYLVGEKGPEIMDVPGGANIYTAPETRQILQRQQSNITIAPVFQGPVDRSSVGIITDELRSLGKNVERAIRGGYVDLGRLGIVG